MKPARPSSPGGGSAGDPSRLTASLRAAHRCVSVEIHPGQFSRWGLLPHAGEVQHQAPELLADEWSFAAEDDPGASLDERVASSGGPGRDHPPWSTGTAVRIAEPRVSRVPPPHRENWRLRRSRGFHHRLFTASLCAARRCVSVEIHPVFLPHAPCQPGASPASALTPLCRKAASPDFSYSRPEEHSGEPQPVDEEDGYT